MQQHDKNPWIVQYHKRPSASMRLFCFPYAGGNSTTYNTWGEMLPKNIEVCCVELPGRMTHFNASPYTQLEPLIENFVTATLPYFDKPFMFFGHSLGSLIAYETARHLLVNDMPMPIYLFTSGRNAPHKPDDDPPVSHLPFDEFIKYMQERYNGIPQEVVDTPELLELIEPTLRADVSIDEKYKHKAEPMLNIPIATFYGKDDELDKKDYEYWNDLTKSLYSIHEFPGDHLYIDELSAEVTKKTYELVQRLF